ncbi:MAG: hypothetical protein ACLFWM_03315 [Actinomycetota bacterium]
MNVLERTRIRPLPRCERCGATAWASTPGGVRCEAHATEELEQAIADHRADWMPRRLRRRRL